VKGPTRIFRNWIHFGKKADAGADAYGTAVPDIGMTLSEAMHPADRKTDVPHPLPESPKRALKMRQRAS